ncbi:MAG: ferritin-like domain-containing protein [Thermoplasmatota archaeon]
MGTKGRSIVGLDVEELIKVLNKALADEWLAYYQYWIGSKVLVGPMKGEVMTELMEHAADELRHADMLVQRIIQLGGKPILTPAEWMDHTNCGYDIPSDPHVRKIIAQNIKGEQCAIGVYDKLMKMTEKKDPITYQIAFEILRDEVEHEEDLQGLEEDIENIK